MIGRRDDHGVEFFRDRTSCDSLDTTSNWPLSSLGRIGRTLQIAIRGGDDLAARRNLVDQLVASAAEADHTDDDLLVGAGRVFAPEYVGRDEQSARLITVLAAAERLRNSRRVDPDLAFMVADPFKKT